MSEYIECVKGRIVDRQEGKPVSGAAVEVYDKDLLLNDYLGAAVTDENGRFEVEFSSDLFKDSVFEDRPDIFLKVRRPDTGETTKTEVFEELSGEMADDDSVEVMDLGDIPVD
jgi:hypothetical protein